MGSSNVVSMSAAAKCRARRDAPVPEGGGNPPGVFCAVHSGHRCAAIGMLAAAEGISVSSRDQDSALMICAFLG